MKWGAAILLWPRQQQNITRYITISITSVSVCFWFPTNLVAIVLYCIHTQKASLSEKFMYTTQCTHSKGNSCDKLFFGFALLQGDHFCIIAIITNCTTLCGWIKGILLSLYTANHKEYLQVPIRVVRGHHVCSNQGSQKAVKTCVVQARYTIGQGRIYTRQLFNQMPQLHLGY